MSMIGEAFVRLRSDDTLYKPEVQRQVRGATRDVERANREFSRFGRGALVGTGALGQLGRAAAFASTSFIGGAGLIVGLKAASDAASSLNEQLARSRVVFGVSASALDDWSRTAASASGLAADEALRAASEFGTLFANIGTSAERSAELSKSIVQLGADLASFADTPVPEALRAIRSGLTGEVEPLRRYGVFLSELQTQQQAFADTGKSVVSQLTTQDKVMARLAVVMKQTTLAQGDFARTSEDLANQQRTLQANLRNLQIVVGEALNPEILRVVRALNDWLSETQNQEKVQREFRQAVRDGVQIVEGFADGLSTLHKLLSPLVGAVGGLTKAIEILLLAMAVNKVAKFSGAITLIGTEAQVSTGRVNLLRGALFRLGALAAVPLVIDVVINRKESVVGRALTTETAGGQVPGRRGSPFPKGTNLDDEYQSWLDAIIKSGEFRAFDVIEALRGQRFELDKLQFELERGVFRGVGRRAGPLEQIRLAVAEALLTPGTADDVRALQAQREQYERALDFARRQIELGRGDTAKFSEDVERLSSEIRGINEDLASIAKDNADKAEAARIKAIEALIPGRIGGTFAAGLGAAQAFITGRLGGVRGGQAETDVLAAVTRAQELAELRRQIAEQRVTNEEDLVPFLEAERQAITEQIRILRLTGADKTEILQAVLEQARLDKRIADVRRESASFTAQDLFSLAAGEFAALGSNVGSIDVALSPQEAGGAAVRAARSVSVNQHFYGQQPNPAQALQQASQAARALR